MTGASRISDLLTAIGKIAAGASARSGSGLPSSPQAWRVGHQAFWYIAGWGFSPSLPESSSTLRLVLSTSCRRNARLTAVFMKSEKQELMVSR